MDLKIAKNTVYDWIRGKDKIIEQYHSNNRHGQVKKVKTSSRPQVDQALSEWFQNLRSRNVKITGPIMLEKANQFCILFGLPPTCNEFYINRWRKRNNILWQGKEHGESASVNPETCKDWLSRLNGICRDYKDENIFNTDETGLFYQMEPSGTMRYRHEKCAGGKQSKTRCTVLLTASLTGEKLPLLIIGKSKNPRCFKNLNKNNLGVMYRNNSNAWMTSDIYNEWMKTIDAKFRKENRRILLFADNFSGHK